MRHDRQLLPALIAGAAALLLGGVLVPTADAHPSITAAPRAVPHRTGAGSAAPAPPTGRGWLTGVVVGAAGRPLPGRLVNALDATTVPEGGLVPDVTDRRTLTDARGRFRVRQAPGGTLIQICHPEPDRPSCKETVRGVDHAITYVGGTGVTDSWVTQRTCCRSPEAGRTWAR